MTREEFTEKIQSIGTIEDDAQRRTALADLQEGITSMCDSLESTQKENDTLKNDNEDLRKANMQLFLKVGQKESSDDIPREEPPKAKRNFDDLFNEKGGIK